jgi:predicted DNA-binding transcriptional regulator YafY
MARKPQQGLKILWLMKLLCAETDEQHPISMQSIIARLAENGIDCERKSIYSDLELLEQFGLDIVYRREQPSGYYVASRDFELPELKLLVDAVQASRFITHKKSLQLIEKLQGLTSRHEAELLRRQLHVSGTPKAANEGIYYTVDAIYSAIAQNRQITFRYLDYAHGGQKHFRRDGARYTVSPYALLWDDEYYYMVGYYEQYGGLSNFRVDKMDAVRISDEPRVDGAEQFDAAEYAKRQFSMFSGEVADVRLKVQRKFIGAAIDRFGDNIMVFPHDDDSVIINAQVEISPIFIAWLFQFGGGIEVLSPRSVRDKVVKAAEQMREAYL